VGAESFHDKADSRVSQFYESTQKEQFFLFSLVQELFTIFNHIAHGLQKTECSLANATKYVQK